MKILLLEGNISAIYEFRMELVTTLIKSGHDLFLITPNAKSDKVKKIESLGVKVFQIDTSSVSKNIFKDIKAIFRLIGIIKLIRPDAALLSSIKPILYGSPILYSLGIKKRIILLEGLGRMFADRLTFFQRFVSNSIKLAYKLSFYLSTNVIFLNNDDANEFTLPVNKITMLGGIGVDLDKFNLTTRPLKDKIQVIMLARLLKEKGVLVYIEAAKKILSHRNDVEFHLLGSLDLAKGAISQKMVQTWVDSGIVNWPGYVDPIPWLSNSDIFVLPSYYREGVPRSSQEALALGLPIITTDNVGCRDTVINNYNGFLIPIKSSDKLIEKIIYFLDNRDKIEEMGRCSRLLAIENFDITVKNKILVDLLTQVN
jgi:glycosyltransferase involved in cell wall biosynthesis